MFEHLLEQKPAIGICIDLGPQTSLSATRWSIMKELILILQPLEEATRELSSEQTVSCSKVIPLLIATLIEL